MAKRGPFRRALFQIHLWTGIGAGLYILLISTTGALLMFRSDLQRAANPHFFRPSGAARPLADVEAVAENFRRAYPGQLIAGIDTPTAARQTFLTYVLQDGRYVAAFAHPVTGAVLGELSPRSFVSRLQDLHFELLTGTVGRMVNGVGAICLSVLALTGVVVWGPAATAWRRAFRVDFSGSWKRGVFNLHRAVGVWTAIVILAWGVSGTYFIFSRPFRAVVRLISPLSSTPPAASGSPEEGRAALPIAAFVEKARQASPSSELVRVLLPTTGRSPAIVTMTHPGLTRAQDDSGVSFYFDQRSGELLQQWDTSPRTAGDRFLALLTTLHMGLFGGGLTVKALWAAIGLAPALLFATGALMWWNRVWRERRTRLHAIKVMQGAAVLLAVLGLTTPAAGQDRPRPAANDIVQISHSGRGAYEATLAPLGSGFAAAWYDTRDGHGEIYLALLDGKGSPVRSETRLTTGTASAYEPDIWPLDEGFALCWYEVAADGASTAKIGVWTGNLVNRWTASLSAPGRRGRNPVARAAHGRIFVAWLEDDNEGVPTVRGQWFDSRGSTTRAQALAPAGATTWNLNLALDDHGRAWVAFDATAATRKDELFVIRVDNNNRTETMRLTTDDGFDSKYPDMAFSGDRVALTWFDARDGNDEVYLFVGSVDQLAEGLERRAVRVTSTIGESIGAYLAWNGRQLGLAWSDNSEGGQHEIFMEIFDDAGEPAAPAVRVTRNPSWSLIPAIRPAGRGFALAWNEYVPSASGLHSSDAKSEVMFAIVESR